MKQREIINGHCHETKGNNQWALSVVTLGHSISIENGNIHFDVLTINNVTLHKAQKIRHSQVVYANTPTAKITRLILAISTTLDSAKKYSIFFIGAICLCNR